MNAIANALREVHPVRHVRALLGTWRGRFILVFVLVQLLLPLQYYLGRRDPHDERFAWRMFSPMRMAQCRPSFSVDGQPFDLASHFHEAWIELAQRGRFVVVEDMARQVCEQHPSSSVVVSLDCRYLDGSRRHYGGFDLCHASL